MAARVAALLALVVVAVAAGCGGGGGGTDQESVTTATQDVEVPDGAVALVGETPILQVDLDRLFTTAAASAEANGTEFPAVGTPQYEEIRQQAVDLLVERTILVAEAEARGITVTDEEVTERLDDLKEQFYNGDDEKYQEEIGQIGLTEDDIRTDLRIKVLYEKLFADVTKDVTVSDADVRAYYDENQDRFTTPETREVAHILVATKKEADEVYAELEGGTDFAKLAKERSTDTVSAEEGGRLTARKGELVPEFEQAAFELETGAISKPVETQFGWHVIKAVEDTVPETVTPFDQVEEDTRAQLLAQKRNEAMVEWVAELRAQRAGEVVYAVGFEPPATTATTTTP
jgi:parvulin-like peptidyl-prolyl isomerase